jgi:hypothetical protein
MPEPMLDVFFSMSEPMLDVFFCMPPWDMEKNVNNNKVFFLTFGLKFLRPKGLSALFRKMKREFLPCAQSYFFQVFKFFIFLKMTNPEEKGNKNKQQEKQLQISTKLPKICEGVDHS